jgi:hypothetical protein
MDEADANDARIDLGSMGRAAYPWSVIRHISTKQMTTILDRHDDPDHWECPRDFDWAIESRDFATFVADLETRLGRKFDVETGARSCQQLPFLIARRSFPRCIP